MARKKSLAAAYILWAIGGPWGLHHVYLTRYRQAFLYLTTLGGFLGLGWIRDLCVLPRYVAEYNGEPEYVEQLIRTMKAHSKPPLNINRIAAEIIYGTVIGGVVIAGLPQQILEGQLGKALTLALLPLCTGLAVHLVANIGTEKAELKWPLLGAYLASVFFCFDLNDPTSPICQSAVTSAVLTNWKGKSWRRTKYQRCSLGLALYLSVGMLLYGGLLFSALYHNAYITTSDGEQVRLKDAIGNIRKSEAFKRPLETFHLLLKTYGAVGLQDTWRQLVEAIDPQGELNAYQVLGVYPGVSEKALKSAYLELVRQYHPDKASTASKKANFEQRFIEIQRAFDTLSTIRMKRTRANRLDRSDNKVNVPL